jgi:hypothetical protein
MWQDYIRDMGLTAVHFDVPVLDPPSISKKSLSIPPVCNFDSPDLSPRQRIWQLKPQFSSETPRFIFRLVMRNVDFHLGFFINRKALNRLMNSSQYADRIKMSQCETTGHTNVNIKMYTKKPDNYTYNCLVYPLPSSRGRNISPHFIQMAHNPYKPLKKPNKKKYTTFIVFSSSEIILTGRYKEDMKSSYYFFIEQVFQHREKIEEKIRAPKLDLISFLKGMGEGSKMRE